VTARVIVSCDAVHADRVPPRCRAFLVTRTVHLAPAYDEAFADGWTQDVGDVDRCPSCSRVSSTTDGTCPHCGAAPGDYCDMGRCSEPLHPDYRAAAYAGADR
jgi:hypothetical protein